MSNIQFICDKCKKPILPGQTYSHKLDKKDVVIPDKFVHVPPTRCRKKAAKKKAEAESAG